MSDIKIVTFTVRVALDVAKADALKQAQCALMSVPGAVRVVHEEYLDRHEQWLQKMDDELDISKDNA